MPSASHVETFNCSVPEFFKIVSDYEKYPQFLAEVKDCKILKTDGHKKLVEYKVSVVKSFTYQMWMTEQPNLGSWEFTKGYIFKTSTGSWKLDDVGGKCKATYSVDATFGVFVPGMVANTLLKVNLPAMMAAYHKRIKEVYGK
ncbi:MAG: SRPBCC family protein [Bdellovibrionota bacterium]|mgnify:FL=1